MRGRSRGPLPAALFFAGTLFPALGFFDVYPFRFSFVADHFQYLASLGPIALATALLARAFEGRRLRLPALAALLAGLAALTFRQSRTYADDETLSRATLQENPSSWMAWNNLAVVLLARGAVVDALEPVQRALALHPDPEGQTTSGWSWPAAATPTERSPSTSRRSGWRPDTPTRTTTWRRRCFRGDARRRR